MIDLIKIFDYAQEDLWRDVKGYEGLYQVSHTGKVRSLNYYRSGKIQELKPRIKNDYYYVTLCKNGKGINKYIHRLVAEAFIPNNENKPQIDHKNTIRQNNHVRNLRWCTRKENANNEITKVNKCLSRLGKNGKKHFLYDKNKNFIWEFDTKGQLAFYLSKYTEYKVGSIEFHFLNKNNKYNIVNTGILFADKFYAYDYKLD